MREGIRDNRTCQILWFGRNSYGRELLVCWTHRRINENGKYFLYNVGSDSEKHGPSCYYRRNFWLVNRGYLQNDTCQIRGYSRDIQNTERSYTSTYPYNLAFQYSIRKAGQYIFIWCGSCDRVVWESGRCVQVRLRADSTRGGRPCGNYQRSERTIEGR